MQTSCEKLSCQIDTHSLTSTSSIQATSSIFSAQMVTLEPEGLGRARDSAVGGSEDGARAKITTY
jgi:hypothetical protein